MRKSDILVSVIIPTYNRRMFVYRAVKSVLLQTYSNIECIVIDDRSTDNTLEHLIELSLEDERLILISHLHNYHVSAARNTGILASHGELIAFLDDDDIWLPQKLEEQITLLSRRSGDFGIDS